MKHSVVLSVAHLLVISSLEDSPSLLGLKLSDFNLALPVLNTLLKLLDLVLLDDEFNRVSCVSVHSDLSLQDLLMSLNTV